MFAGIGMLSVVGLKSWDIVYNPLPLYHTVGGENAYCLFAIEIPVCGFFAVGQFTVRKKCYFRLG